MVDYRLSLINYELFSFVINFFIGGSKVSKPVQICANELQQGIFSSYGRILEPEKSETPEVSDPGNFDFYVTFKESSPGWQIGYLINEGKIVNQLERHPNTAEVFSPLQGSAVLVVSKNPEDKNSITAFKLDKPVVLHRGVWHGVISLSEKAEILIVESPDVIDEFYHLPHPITSE
jgi:ureidoglycolate hydrolase